MTASPKITSREQLICVLRSAAELEHLLACQYLFAGFSLRRTLEDFPPGGSDEAKLLVISHNQRWGWKVMEIARQEMEHLGIVANLLGALGERPYFHRPNYPLPASYLPIGVPFVLEAFGQKTIERFLAYERPDYLTVPDAWRDGGPPAFCLQGPDCGITFRDVQELYQEIAAAFQNLPASELFVGDARRQVNNADAPAFGLNVTMMPVTNRDSAQQAINLILEQGEGIGDLPATSEPNHFSSFNTILQQLITSPLPYSPGLPVVANPSLEPNPACPGTTLITAPETRRVMALFNHSYDLMLSFLEKFFAGFLDFYGPPSAVLGLDPLSEFEQRTRNAALLEQAFFPFMTMVIRPLGDYLVRMPAFKGKPKGPRAGPSFELPGGRITPVADFPAALAALAREARKVADATKNPDLKSKLTYLADNMHRMNQNFARVWFALGR